MAFSGYGFGNYAFGQFPFGRANFGEDVVVRSFPATYITDQNGNVNQVLKHYLEQVKHEANRRKLEIDHLENQFSPSEIRSDILKYLGTTLAVELDDYEPEDFRRSLVSNAIQYYQIKGTRDSFRIRGKISGYDVDIQNIWRINTMQPISTTTGYVFSVGTGGASQDFTDKFISFPVVKNTLKVKVNDVLIAEDNGINLIPSSGSPYGVNSVVLDYALGEFSFTLTPAPPAGSIVSYDLQSGIYDITIAAGNGNSTQTISGNLNTVPLSASTFKVFDSGILIAEDDGFGNIVPSTGSSYAVTGTMQYDNGVYSFSLTPAPALGDLITVSYDKTLLSEFLYCLPDDVYEIPSNSGNWYVTRSPESVGGNFTEGCGFCRTSYIKVRFLVAKPINFGTGSENFFDRLLRKLRDITPIHVRDLLYELQMLVTIDESENLQFTSRMQEETSWLFHPCFALFDVVPADVITCDAHGTVTGTQENV